MYEKAKKIVSGGVNSSIRAFTPYPFFTSHPVSDYQSAKKIRHYKVYDTNGKLHEKRVFIVPSQFETCFVSDAYSEENIEKTIEVLKLALE